MDMDTMGKVKLGVGVVAVVAVSYVGYKVYKAVTGMVSNIGTGKNVTGAASTVWSARPKVIFKGIDNDELEILGGLG